MLFRFHTRLLAHHDSLQLIRHVAAVHGDVEELVQLVRILGGREILPLVDRRLLYW